MPCDISPKAEKGYRDLGEIDKSLVSVLIWQLRTMDCGRFGRLPQIGRFIRAEIGFSEYYLIYRIVERVDPFYVTMKFVKISRLFFVPSECVQG